MTFKENHQNQIQLLPPSIKDFLGESHEAVILNEFLQELDLSILEKCYKNEHGGRAAYHPNMILAVLIYSYMNGIFSSRQIAKRLHQDLAFMYLAGSLQPDFRTLARFRKEKGNVLESIMVLVVRKAQELGMVSFGTCSLDGTKIRANASKEKNYHQDGLKRSIRAIIAEVERIDREEDNLYGEDNVDAEDPELKTKAGRERRKKELEGKKRAQEQKLTRLGSRKEANLTDPDAKLMKLKQGAGCANAYNIQSITENGIILSNSIFDTSADQGTLIPAIKQCSDLHGQSPKRLLADKGYSSEDNYEFCQKNKINAYIPNYTEPIDLSRFKYDKKTDTYTDKQGRVYVFKQHMERRDGEKRRGRPPKKEAAKKQHKFYKRTIYEYLNRKTGSKKYLSVSPRWQAHVLEQKRKLSTVYGKRIYRKRMTDVEGVFANIKKNLGFRTFGLRGIASIAAEWTLVSLAHNLKKLM